MHRWVTEAGVSNNEGRAYNISRSPTAKPHLNETFFQGFPQSSVSGIIVDDTVALANTSAVVNAFGFGVVDQKSSGISSQPFDGFLGLGFSVPDSNGKVPRILGICNYDVE